ncbi:MAG TPA: VanZ family protein [Terriglobales bacterium]|nr:VanZ family protein [Terriglobales bacterium]
MNAPVADANTIATARQRKLLGVALLAMLGIILYAGVRPLQFHPPNGARWIAGADGIRFEERGIVYSDQAFRDLVQPAADRQEAPFTIELEFESSKSAASDMAHILSDDEDDISPRFLISQWGSYLILKALYRSPDGKRFSFESAVPRLLRAGRPVHLVITTAPGETILYVDGRPAAGVKAMLDLPRYTGRLLLGSAGTASRSWLGIVRALAIYERSFSAADVAAAQTACQLGAAAEEAACYQFRERIGTEAHEAAGRRPALHVPATVVMLRRNYLAWDLRFTRNGVLDVAVNVTGFVPFGALVTAYLVLVGGWSRGKALAASIAIAALLSCGIELTQAFIPGRDSSSTDVAMNVLGAGVGAAVWFNSRRIRWLVGGAGEEAGIEQRKPS